MADRPHLEPDRLRAPLARLLRPLVRLLIRNGITFPVLVELLRELYVNVAEYDFELPGKEQTSSRVSLVTGVHRKEVRRLRGAGAPVGAVPAALSRTSRILARWLAVPGYVDLQGRPVPLPRMGAAPSFEALVASVTKDVRPRAVLDEWRDRGIVTVEGDTVILAESALLPRRGDAHQLYFLGRNLHDHIAAAAANVEEAAPRFFERAVHYDGLSLDLAVKLEQRSRALATEALQAANREANAACEREDEEREAGTEAPTWRWNFGIYIYAEDTAARKKPAGAASGDEPA